MEQREDLKRWLDNLAKAKKEEMALKNFSVKIRSIVNEWVQLYECGRYVAETLEIPYKERDINDNYKEIEFIHNGIKFVCLETKEN